MTLNVKSDQLDTASLIFKLCRHITKQPDEIVESSYRFVLKALSSSPLNYEPDELVLSEKVKKKMVRQGRSKDALTFADLYRQLQNSKALRHRNSVLTLLYNLYDTNRKHTPYVTQFVEPTHLSHEMALHPKDVISNKTKQTRNIAAEILRAEDSMEHQREFIQTELEELAKKRNSVTQMAAMFTMKADLEKTCSTWATKKYEQRAKPEEFMEIQNDKFFNIKLQRDLLRDIIFSIQGISGKNIHWKEQNGRFEVNIDDSLGRPVKNLALRFSEMGWMFAKIDNFCKSSHTNEKLGLIGQGFVAALEAEMREYYRMLAVLQAQLQTERDSVTLDPESWPLTLHRLSVWFLEPFRHLQFLGSIVDTVTNENGGKIASILYSYMQHGNKTISETVKRLLMAAIEPLYNMIINWIFCGDLNDVFEEFFIKDDFKCNQKDIWHQKYSLNKAMKPSFLSIECAKKVLSVGKAINFLREVCGVHSLIPEGELLKKKQDTKIMKSLLVQGSESEFNKILEENYKKTSKLVLEALYNEHKLMAHFQAIRNFLLLGQGDFIRHIMDLLEPELTKPATSIQEYILSATLESAIQATNAQFHDPEVLQRLNVRLTENTSHESGWDVFLLTYNIEGGINTVFTENSMLLYNRIFRHLWYAKHVEYMLTSICQERSSYIKFEEHIPAVKPVAFKCNILLSQMVHFMQQIQYYNAFEVMECNWVDLLQKMEAAKDLDEIINAHSTFLEVLVARCLLNQESKELFKKMNTIFSLIVKFHDVQAIFWSKTHDLIKLHEEQSQLTNLKTNIGTWGTCDGDTQLYEDQLQTFKSEVISKTIMELKIMIMSYEYAVQEFLLMLVNHKDDNLRLLSFRLDFNEHFKKQNNLLRTSLTFSHFNKRSQKFV